MVKEWGSERFLLGIPAGGPLGALLQNFISTSIVSSNSRTIRPVVIENSSGQNLGWFRPRGFACPRGPSESSILKFETLLQNFRTISFISTNFRKHPFCGY